MNTARDLAARLAALLSAERAAMADFLVALADFDRRRLWVQLGHSSLFYFLHRQLGLSKGAAYHRMVAAELLQRFPDVAAPLRDGRLCLSSVTELARVLTPENQADVLPRFFHRSKQEARAVAVELRPVEAAPRREVVTLVLPGEPAPVAGRAGRSRSPPWPSPPHAALSSSGGEGELPRATATSAAPPTVTAAWPRPRPPTDQVEPLSRDLRRLHITVSRRFLEKLEAARDGHAHVQPTASAEQVLEAALDLLLERQARRRGQVKRPRDTPAPAGEPAHRESAAGAAEVPSEPPAIGAAAMAEQPANVAPRDGDGPALQAGAAGPASAYVPAPVRRAVWVRDGGRCQWPLGSGAICGATRRLELDHIRPRARGGPTVEANLRILCHFHNQLAARRAFGDDRIDAAVASG